MTRDEGIERFLRAVSDRMDADWNELERTSRNAEDRALVRNLRALRAIAEHGAPLATAEPDAPRGTWGQLTLLEKIGAGSYGEVYRAWDPKLAIDVALKLVPSSLASPDEALREGRLLARVRHENVARLYGVDHRDGHVGIRTEYVRGVTLRDVVRESAPLPAARLAALARQLLSALAAIHDAHVLHRDLKPENILVDAQDRVVVTDFGCGMARGIAAPEHMRDFAGTPRFMAPELFDGGVPSPGTDCYSLGVILFQLAAGSFPVEAADVSSLRTAYAGGARRSLADERPDLPRAFTAAVDRALDPDPLRRFRSAREWLAALDDGAAPAPVGPRRVARSRLVPALVTVAAGFLLAAVAWWALGRTAPPVSFRAELLTARAEGPFRALGNGGAASVRVGDRLMLEYSAPREAHVYVLNWDDEGRAYVLFPMRGSELRNPLPGGGSHRLPGHVNGQPFAWEVSSGAGLEHFAVVTSLEPLAPLEDVVRDTPGVRVEAAGTVPPEALAGLLRGVGRARAVAGAGAERPDAVVAELQRRLDQDPALRRTLAVRVLTVAQEAAAPEESR